MGAQPGKVIILKSPHKNDSLHQSLNMVWCASPGAY